ncbi:MAG: hypothetical protein IPK08_12680 [Bacteroidetes bacterium]|nr:hypothetical protein [Bacteroidota bacterium]
MVTDYPIYELDEKPAAARMIKYPMAGEKAITLPLVFTMLLLKKQSG